VKGAGAGDDEEGEVGDVRGELVEGPLAAGVVEAGMGDDRGGPCVEEFLLGLNAGGYDGDAGLSEEEGGELAVERGWEVAGVPGAAGVYADDLHAGEASAERGASGGEVGGGEEEIGLEAIRGEAGGAGAVEEDIREMAAAGLDAGAEALMEGEPAEKAGPHGDATFRATKGGGEEELGGLRVGEEDQVEGLGAHPCGEGAPSTREAGGDALKDMDGD